MRGWFIAFLVGTALIAAAAAITVASIRGLPDQLDGCDVAAPAGALPDPAILAVGHGEDGATRLALGRRLCVRVANIVPASTPQQPGAARAPAADAQGIDVALFLNGVRMPVLATARAQAAPQTLVFLLAPMADAKAEGAASWRSILGGIGGPGERRVTIGIGLDDARTPTAVSPARATLAVFAPMAGLLAFVGLVMLILAMLWASRGTTLLRDVADGPYSLGRVQMAFWMIASVAGFVFIWVVTGQYLNVVSSATFTLLGISGATGFVAQAVDTTAAGTNSKGLIADILSDDSGPQLHRIQIALWTLVLGAIYVWNIAGRLELTEFDTNLLILVGVAGGVYAGLKTRES